MSEQSCRDAREFHFYLNGYDDLSQDFWKPVRPLVQLLLDSSYDKLVLYKKGEPALTIALETARK